MIDRTKFTEVELELMDIALEKFPVAFELAISTQDEELFEKVLKDADKILVERTLNGLIEKGYVEMCGVDENGEFMFSLTEKGKEYAASNLGPVEDGPEL